MRVLAIDGGGIRGLLPGVVLAELERLSGQPTHQLFDLIAGSSAGGLVAAALAVPGDQDGARWTANEVTGLFEREGARIFRRTLGRSIRTRFGFSRPRYSDETLNEVLTDYCGSVRLRDATTNLMICSYDVERRTPVRFNSWDAKRDSGHDRALWQVARATIAAPTYFAPMRVTPPGKHAPGSLIDGGIVAHNPALLGAIEGATLRPQEQVTIVSLGTGELNKRLRWEEASTWGAVRWARPMIDMFFDASSSIVQEQLDRMLGERNHRFQIPLTGCTEAMDDASPRNLAALRRNAELLIEQRHDELVQLAHDLLPENNPVTEGDRRETRERRRQA
ncbi:MAG: patatin-like phospholipase family protein [Solirubrobacteraceae bacterium]|nr:patatin-like phospholipase family protein [Solirubrobacteraceae bacterium]